MYEATCGGSVQLFRWLWCDVGCLVDRLIGSRLARACIQTFRHGLSGRECPRKLCAHTKKGDSSIGRVNEGGVGGRKGETDTQYSSQQEDSQATK